ncbi:MAG: hypothetical protein LIO77_05925, partial [Rikenellaceae bacterium]|nr:hypothetical protein [Rikenellaceae bacterium]
MFMDTYARVLRQLESEKIRILSEKELDERQMEFCREYFANIVSQRIVPLMILKSMRIPFLPDCKIY